MASASSVVDGQRSGGPARAGAVVVQVGPEPMAARASSFSVSRARIVCFDLGDPGAGGVPARSCSGRGRLGGRGAVRRGDRPALAAGRRRPAVAALLVALPHVVGVVARRTTPRPAAARPRRGRPPAARRSCPGSAGRGETTTRVPAKSGQGRLQRLAAADVQVVGGLVQQQGVVPLLDQAQQGQPPALAARTGCPPGRSNRSSPKPKAPRNAAQLARGWRADRPPPSRRAPCCGPTTLRQLLVVEAQVHVVARAPPARRRAPSARPASSAGSTCRSRWGRRCPCARRATRAGPEPSQQGAPAVALAQPVGLAARCRRWAAPAAGGSGTGPARRRAAPALLLGQLLAARLGLLGLLALDVAADVVLGLPDAAPAGAARPPGPARSAGGSARRRRSSCRCS